MTKKQYLERLIDIGGVATINNFYSPEATTLKGALVQPRRNFKEFEAKGLIKRLDPILKPRNPAQEVFYAITKAGVNLVGGNYKYKDNFKSPVNAFHESMKFDFALSWLRLIDREAKLIYTKDYDGLRPDITILSKGHKYLVEIERKKTIDRTIKEKFGRYEKMFDEMRKNNNDNPKNYTVLFVYTNTWFNIFARPQQYEHYTDEINKVNEKTLELAKSAKGLSYSSLFMPFHKFNQLEFYLPNGNRTSLMI